MTTVIHLGPEPAFDFFEQSMETSEQARAILRAMEDYGPGLQAMPDRSQVFMTYSPQSRKSIAISVTPVVDKEQRYEGELSVSQGEGHATGVIVHMENRTEITRFTTFFYDNGEVRIDEFDRSRLDQVGVRRLAEDAGKIRASRSLVEITPRQVRTISNISFNTLVSDATSRTVHPPEEIAELRKNVGIISDISQFVLLRTSGSACCSCSCSCWGSSSCSCSYAG
jgi:hypothetical protein